MGILDRAISRGIARAVDRTITNAIDKTVTDNVAPAMNQAAQNLAKEAAKALKICPACGEAASADKQYCAKCGAALPAATVAQAAVCASCGKQNDVGARFCSSCGAKLSEE
ncbi:MAG: zinc ribbon domain-containing protein [Clostridiales bacterium]|nr:zinc ribbon domain-containing protein [Clostridiales bacterium]